LRAYNIFAVEMTKVHITVAKVTFIFVLNIVSLATLTLFTKILNCEHAVWYLISCFSYFAGGKPKTLPMFSEGKLKEKVSLYRNVSFLMPRG